MEGDNSPGPLPGSAQAESRPGAGPGQVLFAKPVPPCATLIPAPGTAGSGECCPSPLPPSRCSPMSLQAAPGCLSVTPAALSGVIWVSFHPWSLFGGLSPVVPSLARISGREGGGTGVAAPGERCGSCLSWDGAGQPLLLPDRCDQLCHNRANISGRGLTWKRSQAPQSTQPVPGNS